MQHKATKNSLTIFVNYENKLQKVGDLLSQNEKLTLAGQDYIVYGIQLAPANIGGHEVCPASSEQCRQACIYTSGRGRFTPTQIARIKRKLAWFQERELFKARLIWEIQSRLTSANKKGLRLAIRLNVFSDIVWEKLFPELFTMFPSVQFYDYTKIKSRLAPDYKLPSNYNLTFSRSENTDPDTILELASRGINTAVPFDCKKGELPSNYLGLKVIDGDKHDSRFMDDKGVIVGLSVKGSGKKQSKTANSFIVKPNASPSRFIMSLI